MALYNEGDKVVAVDGDDKNLINGTVYTVRRISYSGGTFLHLMEVDGGWTVSRFEKVLPSETAISNLKKAIRQARASGIEVRASYVTTITKEL